MNKKVKRFIIGIVLVCVSLVIGIVSGIKIASSKKTAVFSTPTEQLVNILKENWYSDIYYGEDTNEDILIDQFIGALSTSDKVRLDPYTYLIKNENGTPSIETGKLGITISFYYNYPVIIDVSQFGASYGILQIGDIITKTGKNEKDEFSITDNEVNFSNILNLALGIPGENIFLKIARFDENNALHYIDLEIELKGATQTAYAYIEEENIEDTIMVKLTSFVSGVGNNDTCNQLDDILSNNPSKNLILDIRDNGGGDLSSVVNICDLFLPEKTLVTTLIYKNGSKGIQITSKPLKYEYDKIIILQNGNTASASEILISTLSYYYPEKVTLIGNKSYGKGIAQRKVNVLNNQYTLQYTCAKWLRPDGTWIGMNESFYHDNYPLGFEPSKDCSIEKNNLLTLMEKNNSYVFYKTDSDAYQMDKVASQNKYFFEIINEMYQMDCRIDFYFDENCLSALKHYQKTKQLSESGLMDENTFLYFVKDFYDERNDYSLLHLKKAEEIIKGALNG